MRPKEVVYAISKATGVTDLVAASAWRRHRHLILCYHGVSTRDEHEWNGELYITQDRLRHRLRFLREHDYEILSLDAALKRLSAGTLPPKSVSLTFDDGALDFATHAVPVLREFQAPATVYLTTYYSEHEGPVFDTGLRYVLWKGRASGADLAPLLDQPGPLGIVTDAERNRVRTLASAHVAEAGLGGPEKFAWLGQVGDAVGVDVEALAASGVLRIMPPEVVRSLPRDLIDIELHTHRHRTPRHEAAFRREIEDNRACIAAMTSDDRSRVHFCYPSGDYSQSFLAWLGALGVTSATTCLPGLADLRSHPLLLPRFIDTMSVSDLTFEAWTSGVASWLPQRARYKLDPSRA